MLYLFIKAALSGVIVAAVSEIAKRYPGFGGLVASLPLVSVLGMIWLWRDTRDTVRMASHARGRSGSSFLRCRCSC
ncbi:MAG: peptide transporter permease [Alphaproteobacteria bacterium]|nr:peptide transporter permease [Alphaproteobacteria bacterium]